jgi:hypothetical protein
LKEPHIQHYKHIAFIRADAISEADNTPDGVDGGLHSQMAINLLYANDYDLADPSQ